ncbi:Detected protein of confused Function [Hibiscus syriacus]|uniref:Detected protein of confused Function n=1 Tax=Hibiscus syriacus TaxID=106335 RepID=A0A6A2ZNZ5_HIBSY|nr:Detected protein of confused Function [Hibiscus syriacus]
MAQETQTPETAAAEEVVVEKEKAEEAAPPAVVVEKQGEVIEAVEEPKVTQSASFKEETNIVGKLPDAQKKALEELKQLIQEALHKHEFSAPPPPPPAKEKEAKPSAKEKKEEDKPAPETEEKAPEKVETEAAAPVEVKEEEKTTPPAEAPAPETEVVEKAPAVEDDGAKTVEAIEESVVAVAAPPAAEKPDETASSAVEPEVVPKDEPKEAEVPPPPPKEVSIWGIPLLADERSDVILWKFLRARDFKVKDTFTMIKNTVIWRKEFGVESLPRKRIGESGFHARIRQRMPSCVHQCSVIRGEMCPGVGGTSCGVGRELRAEFVPTADDGYTVIILKTRKVGPADETVISDRFKTGEAGKIVLTIDNQATKKKKLLYRSKAKPYSD